MSQLRASVGYQPVPTAPTSAHVDCGALQQAIRSIEKHTVPNEVTRRASALVLLDRTRDRGGTLIDRRETVFEIDSPSTDTTVKLGEALGSIVRPGDVLGIVGKLGAGKTWLAKGIAYGLGVPRHEYVNSPAYDIVHEYHGRATVYHMDFYRIDDIGDDEYLWLDEYFGPDGVCVCEWADKFLSRLTDSYLEIEISWNIDTDVRRIRFSASSERYEDVIKQLKDRVHADA